MKRSSFYGYLIALNSIWMLGVLTIGAGGHQFIMENNNSNGKP